jgi:hypothetical protein
MQTSKIIGRTAPVLLLCQSLAWSWGPEGHQVVGRVAALNLNANAAKQVAAILGVSVDSLPAEMAHASTWADAIRTSFPETGGWHFVDIPRDKPAGKPSDFCPGDDCVSFRIADFTSRLKSNKPGPDAWKRSEQLKFLIHFVGDVHQPLHCATNSDKGGNCVSVPAFKKGNLHHVWDSEILAGIQGDDSKMAQLLSDHYRAMSQAARDQLVAGTPEDWAMASHKLALDDSYGFLKPSIPVMKPQIEVKDCQTEAPPAILKLKVKLSQTYFNQTEPIVQDQLTKAGARLADILNTIWP